MKLVLPTLAAASACLVALSHVPAAAQGGTCVDDWLPAFGGLASVDGAVYDAIVFDDGSGPALYVGGAFRTAGGVEALNIARFDGTAWSAVGAGLGIPGLSNYDSVRALEVYDDGSGPALFAAGDFPVAGPNLARNLARWDGTNWLQEGFVGGVILDLEVYDDGTGAQLYAGGSFTSINGPALSVGVARYNGSQWNAVDEGVWSGNVTSLVAHDDGSGAGPSLFVGGTFSGIRNTQTGGVISRVGITRWNSQGWSAVGQGLNPSTPSGQGGGYVLDMALFDFGSGSELVLGGSITLAGGLPVNDLARWNGSSWADVGGGVDRSGISWVSTLASFDSGSGARLMVGGIFDSAGTNPGYQNLASFDGASWSNPGRVDWSYQSRVTGLVPYQFGGAPRLLVGGAFEATGPQAQPWLSAWTGSGWETIGASSMTLSGQANAFAMYNDGSGEKLYAAGLFLGAGGELHSNVARWNGTAWESAGGGLPTTHVEDLAIVDLGSGPKLYAGGHREIGQGSGSPEVWEFSGTAWSQLPGLPGTSVSNGTGVFDLQVFAGQGTTALYAAGYFGDTFGGSHIARWDGSQWDDLQGGVYVQSGTFHYDAGVRTMQVHDDGAGERLFVGGGFVGVAALSFPGQSPFVATFDGANWEAVAPPSTSLDTVIRSFTEVKIGGSQRLVVAGDFTKGTTASQHGLAQWDGTTWSSLPGLPGGHGQRRILHKYDFDGSGEQLILGTVHLGPAQSIDSSLLRLEGGQWNLVGRSVNGEVLTLDTLDDGAGNGPVLYVGGEFSVLGPHGDAFIARYGGCADRELGEPYCVAIVNSTGLSATTTAFGSPYVTANDVTLFANHLPLGSFGYFIASRLQGFALLPGNTQGNLCLDAPVGRYIRNVLNSGTEGSFSLAIDLTAMPQPSGFEAAVAGESWNFQSWYRDANPHPTSNFSLGLEIQLR